MAENEGTEHVERLGAALSAARVKYRALVIACVTVLTVLWPAEPRPGERCQLSALVGRLNTGLSKLDSNAKIEPKPPLQRERFEESRWLCVRDAEGASLALASEPRLSDLHTVITHDGEATIAETVEELRRAELSGVSRAILPLDVEEVELVQEWLHGFTAVSPGLFPPPALAVECEPEAIVLVLTMGTGEAIHVHFEGLQRAELRVGELVDALVDELEAKPSRFQEEVGKIRHAPYYAVVADVRPLEAQTRLTGDWRDEVRELATRTPELVSISLPDPRSIPFVILAIQLYFGVALARLFNVAKDFPAPLAAQRARTFVAFDWLCVTPGHLRRAFAALTLLSPLAALWTYQFNWSMRIKLEQPVDTSVFLLACGPDGSRSRHWGVGSWLKHSELEFLIIAAIVLAAGWQIFKLWRLWPMMDEMSRVQRWRQQVRAASLGLGSALGVTLAYVHLAYALRTGRREGENSASNQKNGR